MAKARYHGFQLAAKAVSLAAHRPQAAMTARAAKPTVAPFVAISETIV